MAKSSFRNSDSKWRLSMKIFTSKEAKLRILGSDFDSQKACIFCYLAFRWSPTILMKAVIFDNFQSLSHCECVLFWWLFGAKNLEIQGFWLVVNLENRSKKSAFRWLKICHYIDERSDFQEFSKLITLWLRTFLLILRPDKIWNLTIFACGKS